MTATPEPGGATVRGVLFDFHDTLASVGDFADWVTGSLPAGTPSDDAERVLAVLSDVWVRAGRRWPGSPWDLDATEHRRAFTQILTEDAGCSSALAAALYASLTDQWRLAPGAHALLTGLKEAGLRIGVISNIALDIRPALRKWGVLDLLDAVVLSYEVGIVKPDPAIFRYAAEAIGCAPADCLMVGDSPTHDGASVRVGMPALLVPKGQGGPRLESLGVLTGRDRVPTAPERPTPAP